jgi:hypothetical protein
LVGSNLPTTTFGALLVLLLLLLLLLLIINLDDSAAGVNRFEIKLFQLPAVRVRHNEGPATADTATEAAVVLHHDDWGDFKIQQSIQQQQKAADESVLYTQIP